MENEITQSIYPILTHSLTQSFVVFLAVFLLTKNFQNKLEIFGKEMWIELGLFVVFASLSLSAIFEGETIFSGFVAKIILFILVFFMTGRFFLKYKKHQHSKQKGAK
ncbi:MAG: hypothetical protein ACTSXV_00830 [Alphaproteobacteria bacterium]